MQKSLLTNTHQDQKNIEDRVDKLFISMKNITKQYQDLLEGKMSKANFMVNVRRDFPQWVSPVNSFDDAVNILKSKRILTEASAAGFHRGAPMGGPSGIRIGGKQEGGEPRKDENYRDIEVGADEWEEKEKVKILMAIVDELEAMEYEGKINREVYDKCMEKINRGEFDIEGNSNMVGETTPADLAKELIHQVSGLTIGDEETSNLEPEDFADEKGLEEEGSGIDTSPEALRKMIDRLNKQRPEREVEPDERDEEDPTFDDRKKGLNEATEKPEGAYKNVTGKAEYDKFAEMDRVDYRQLMKGTEFELLKMPEITDENLVKAKTKAYKALLKNPKAYMHLVTANANEVEKKDKDLRMQPVKGDNRVDKANAMKVIKKDEGSNTQTNLSNKEKAKGNPKGVKEMPDKGVTGTEKVLRESLIQQLRENILDEMIEVGTKQTTHNKGEVVKKKGSNKIGTVREVSSDNTCEVVYEDGSVEDVQGNVLEKHIGRQMDEYEVGDETPHSTLPAYSREKKARDLAAKQATEEYSGIKRKDLVKVDAPGFEKNKTYKVTDFTVINPGKIMRSIDVTVIDDSGAESIVNINSVKKVGEDKNAALKEKLVKSLKKSMDEDLFVDPSDPTKKKTVVASTQTSKTALTSRGFKAIPGTGDVK